VPLPLPPRDYARIVPGAPGELFLLVNEWSGAPALGGTVSRTLYRYTLSRPRELEALLEGVGEFALTADGRKLIYRRGHDWWLAPTSDPGGPEAVPLDLEAVAIEVDPAAEWRQMYDEAWRLVKDYYYDPNYHGQDLAELKRHYAAYLPGLTRRLDLNLLLQRGLSHLSVSRLGATGGDIPGAPGEGERIGLLGADYEVDDGRYRFTRIYGSGPYSSGMPLLRAPLDGPGVRVREGDYLIAVDGRPLTTGVNLYAAFAGKALVPTRITVAAKPDGEGKRTYTVVPLPSEGELRRWNWAERLRRTVEEESQGILGYVYVPEFSDRGLEVVLQQLLETAGARGLIIDARFAGGEVTADQLIEVLGRTPLYYYAFRHGDELPVPTFTPPAAKVLLINDASEGAAETFALMFRLARLGVILGTKTAGVGVGLRATIAPLIDGGVINVPSRAAFHPAGTWDIENDGVEPDTEVPLTLADWWEGVDPQLGTAIRTVLRMIVSNPPLEVKKPEYPVHR
jgi:tricorn protease